MLCECENSNKSSTKMVNKKRSVLNTAQMKKGLHFEDVILSTNIIEPCIKAKVLEITIIILL